MRVQIITKQKPLACDEAIFENIKSLWQNISLEDSSEALTLIHAEEIDPTCDIYLEVISAKKLKIGVLPEPHDYIINAQINEKQFNNLHWVTIDDNTCDQTDFLSKILSFIIGMVCAPNQLGVFMTDWADLRIALQYGSEAKYISTNELKTLVWSNAKTIVSNVMLLNSDLPFSKKTKIVASMIPHELLSQGYLTIANITNTSHLPRTNTLLLVYKNFA